MDFHLPLTSRQSSLFIITLIYSVQVDYSREQNYYSKKNMIESPIRRKMTQYPQDFLPSSQRRPQTKRFTFNEDYQIEVSSIRKYQKSIEQPSVEHKSQVEALPAASNPENTGLTLKELEEDNPLEYHQKGKMPSLDEDLLKKPRFSLNDQEEILQIQEPTLDKSMSPGFIRKQLENRQAPLPLSDPVKIELIKATQPKPSRSMKEYIKYRSSSDFHKWQSSEKDILKKFNNSRVKPEVSELPKLSKVGSSSQDEHFAAAKEQYDSFRRRQISSGSFGKVNSVLHSIKNGGTFQQLPQFQSSHVQKLKEEINCMVRNKKGSKKQEQSEGSSGEEDESPAEHIKNSKTNYKQLIRLQQNQPQLLISYRSSLSYLKDLYTKSQHLSEYRLVVKIPKLFVEKLIFREQEREDLYQTARSIFQELKIPYENLIIKKYTNCTMMVARNICLIWHFDGRRYLGGWQSQYLDQGFKHGLGLEWQPKKYVYYGEFVKNKKQGLGIYKDRNQNNYIGYWDRGQKVGQQEMTENGFQGNEFQEEGEEDEDNFYGRQQHQYQYL